jgi:uncharacterized protein
MLECQKSNAPWRAGTLRDFHALALGSTLASLSFPTFSIPRPTLPDWATRARLSNLLEGVNPHLLMPTLIAVPALLIGAAIEIFGNEDLGRGIIEAPLHHPLLPPTTLDAEQIAESVLQLRPGTDDHAPRLNGIKPMDGHDAASGNESKATGTASGHAGPEGVHYDMLGETPRHSSSQALVPAPIDGLTQPGPGGLLPVISPTGETVADAYARPFSNPSAKPALAILVRGLGLSASATEAAIRELPAEVTLAFSAYAPDLQDWINRARADGHEVILELPMEPFDFPRNDPGPHTLLADAAPGENRRRLEWLLARATGYFAVINHQGARFVAADAAAGPLAGNLRDRGVGLLYDGESPRARLGHAAASRDLAYGEASQSLDEVPTPEAMDRAFLLLEAEAIARGGAFGTARPTPVALGALNQWIATLPAKGYVLAPVSALTKVGQADTQTQGSQDDEFAPQAAGFVTLPSSALSRGQEDAKDDKKSKKGGDNH